MEEKKKRGRPKKIVEQKLGETEMALKEENLIKKNESEKIVEDAKSEVANLVGKTESEAQKNADKIIEKARV